MDLQTFLQSEFYDLAFQFGVGSVVGYCTIRYFKRRAKQKRDAAILLAWEETRNSSRLGNNHTADNNIPLPYHWDGAQPDGRSLMSNSLDQLRHKNLIEQQTER